jgi:hypothetical protein
MRRAPLAAIAAAVVVVLGIPFQLLKDADRKRDIVVSTPTLVGLITVANTELSADDTACLEPITFTPEAPQVQLTIQSDATRSLELEVRGPGWSERHPFTSVGARNIVRVPVDPPRTLTGTLCVTNTGHGKATLIGTNEPRSRTAVSMTVNGRPGPEGQTFAVSLLGKSPQTLLARLDDAVRGASTLSGGLAPEFLLWILLVVCVVGILAFPVAALFLAAGDDYRSSRRSPRMLSRNDEKKI